MKTWAFALWGAAGGAVRVIVGILKALRSGQRIKVGYSIATLILSALVGAFIGALVDKTPQAAALSGYVGPDVIESLAKIVVPKTTGQREQ